MPGRHKSWGDPKLRPMGTSSFRQHSRPDWKRAFGKTGLWLTLLAVACAPEFPAHYASNQGPQPEAQGWSAAIVGGTETSAHPSVVALLWQDEIVCSGIATATHRVITAGHCVYGASDPGDFLVRSGPDANLPEREAKVDAFTVHPDYAESLLPDLAILQLDPSAPNLPALLPNSSPLDDEVLGATATLVAYGRTTAGSASDGLKRQATVVIDSNNGEILWWNEESAGICSGDSGGGLFLDIDGVPTLAALLTEGDPDCGTWGQAQRTDPWSEWLANPLSPPDDDTPDTESFDPSGSETAGTADSTGCSCEMGAPPDNSGEGPGLPPGLYFVACALLATRRLRPQPFR